MTTMQITPVFTFMETARDTRWRSGSPPISGPATSTITFYGARSQKGDSTGTAFMPFLRIRYLFANRIFLAAQLDYLILNTKGHQTQSYYLPVAEAGGIPGWYARTENRLKSEQLSVGLGAGYSFEL